MSAAFSLSELDPLAKLAALVAELTEEVRSLKLEVSASRWPTAKKAVDLSKALLSKKDAARILGIDRQTTLQDLIDTKQIAIVPGSRGIRIPRSEIDRLLESGIPKPGVSMRKAPRKMKNAPPPKDVGAKIRALKI